MTRIAVSSIAWSPAHNDAIAALLRSLDVSAIELAPTTRWPDPARAPDAEVDEYRDWWAAHGIAILSMQSLLYGRPDLQLFGDPASRRAMIEHLDAVMRLAARLGAVPLVFGSPSNRRIGEGRSASDPALRDVAREFFTEAGRRAEALGVVLCIEPNPPQYGCDFLTCTDEAVSFLDEVDARGLGLHLDAAAMALNGEDPLAAATRGRRWLRHYHASEPFLAPLGTGGVDHEAHARALRAVDYPGLVSIEMRAVEGPDSAAQLGAAIRLAQRAYLPGGC